jgi:hypothetical protein
MRKAITLVGLVGLLTSAALSGMAHAQETPVATSAGASAAAAPQKKWQLGLAFLPMGLGEFKSTYGTKAVTSDAAFCPGISLSVSYRVIQGLTVGLAPQVLFKVAPKEDPLQQGMAVTNWQEFDGMVRIAYTYQLVETIAVYAEVLPGYSFMKPERGDPSRGFVIAGGAGLMMDMSDRLFVNVAGGYQVGFQSRTDSADMTTDTRARYVRTVLGVGWRF